MPTVLHDLVVTRPRDLFRVRQRARQVAGTLRLSPAEQLLFAVTVFDLACQGWKHRGPVTVRFVLDGDRLQVWLPAAPEGPDADEPTLRLDAGSTPAWDVTAFRRLLRRMRDRPAPPADDRPLFDMPVPGQNLGAGREDLPFVIDRLAELTPLRLLDEIEQHNADLLRLLRQVQRARDTVRPAPQPAAA